MVYSYTKALSFLLTLIILIAASLGIYSCDCTALNYTTIVKQKTNSSTSLFSSITENTLEDEDGADEKGSSTWMIIPSNFLFHYINIPRQKISHIRLANGKNTYPLLRYLRI